MNHIRAVFILPLVSIAISSSWADIPAPPDVCSSGSCPSTSQRSVKWNPGHYLLGMAGKHTWPQIYSGGGRDYIEGTQILYGWGEICATSDPSSCDFSGIHADIDELEAHGKRVWLLIRQSEFNWRARQGYCAPKDMFNHDNWAFQMNENGTDKCHVKLWDPAAMDLAIKFMVALGREFDPEAAVEGVMFEETALGLGRENEHEYEYDHEQYKDQLKRRMTEVAAAFPTSQVHQMANWLSGDTPGLESLFEHASSLPNVGIGGPDPRTTDATNFFETYASQIPLHLQGQRATTFGTPQSVYDNIIVPFKLNYFFWPGHWHDDPDWDWEDGVLPVVKREVDRGNNTVQACPTALACD